MDFHIPKKRPLPYLRLLVSISTLAYLLSFIDLDRIMFILPRLRVFYVWPAFFLLILLNLAVAARWSILLKHLSINQSILDSWRFYMIGGFYGLVLPGVIGGDVVRFGLSLKKNSNHKALLTTSILFERSCGILVLMIMAAFATLLAPILIEGDPIIATIIPWVAFLAGISFFLIFVIIKKSSSPWFHNPNILRHLNEKITLIIGHFRRLSYGLLVILLLLSLLAHLFDILGCFFLSRALHIDQSLFIFLLIMPIVYVLTILPISIGGIGVREGVFTFFLVKVGVSVSDAVLLAFIIYLNRVAVGMVGGVLQINYKRCQT